GLGLLVGLAGVGLVVGVEALGTAEQALGALALLVTALVYVFAGLTFRTHYRAVPVSVTAGLGILPALPFALLALLIAGPQSMPGTRTVGSLLLLGSLGIAVALIAFYSLQRRVGPVRALLVSYLNPIVAVLLGVALLGESLTPAIAAGMALIVAGVTLATRPDPRLAGAVAPALPDRAPARALAAA
ncbi:MAG: EamA family transporter, partial [Solirubrobacterales bacterium]|nr:EamA family transporter [Solirubrobacterales bacterium]